MELFTKLCYLAVAGLALAGPSTTPVNNQATTATRSLLSYLVQQASDGNTLSGQQDLESAQWVLQNIGKWPAILGVDFMDYSPSRVEYGASATTVEDAIGYYDAGGIVTFCWHWGEYMTILPLTISRSVMLTCAIIGSPTGTYNSDSQPWWSNFYTEATGFDLANAMNNPGSSDYNLLIRDIDVIAGQLKRLQDRNIPVLWRPLHEAEGGWFWWGAKGAEPCKALYRLMYDRMTNHHGLTNLLWVWNSVDPSWYPGNDVVDIVSADIYSTPGDHSSQGSTFSSLQSLTGDTKLIALGEVGNIPDPVNTRAEGKNWAYWVVWNGDFIKGDSHNPLQYKYDIFSSPYILNRDEISGWQG